MVLPLVLACVKSAAALAQANYPSGPMRIVSPYPPGGGTDILGRTIAQKLNEAVKQPVIVENRAGANGTIGAAFVAKAPADGQTMLIVPAGYAANPALYKSLSYDQSRDLSPVSHLASGPLVLVVHPSLPAKSVKELIALAKSRPGAINVGSAGTGSLPHLSAELFNMTSGAKLTHIPYKGSGAAIIDVLSGQVPVYFMNILQSLSLIKSGKLRAGRYKPAALRDRAGPSGDCAGRTAGIRHDELVRIACDRRHPARHHDKTAAGNGAHSQHAGIEGAACGRWNDSRCQHTRAVRSVSRTRDD